MWGLEIKVNSDEELMKIGRIVEGGDRGGGQGVYCEWRGH